ncbi:MAG TPA: response regulator transcription factor [Bryobacteraceae bacterium]|nr:response regulator transcription factor [Bryobacteraceae bacterium]
MDVTIPTPPISILLVDDDPAFRKGLAASLKASGYAVDLARNAEEALHHVRGNPVDVVLLDMNMPEIGGVEACHRIRALAPKSGIVMLTVRDAEDDKVQALEAGADDYVTKPFRLRELIARLRAVLRRTGADGVLQSPVLRVGQLELEVEHRTLRKAGRQIHLTPKEFELLAFLMQHKDFPVTHARLLRAVWGPEYGNEPDYLRSYVKMLRKKIEDDPSRPEYILTEPWVGYRLRDPSDPESPVDPENDAEDEEDDF